MEEVSSPLDADFHVINRACHWLQQGAPVWLATVLATYGSSPRPAGSLWAWSANFGMAGSLSGGCVEEDLVQRLRCGAVPTVTQRVRFGECSEQQQRYRLPCGGVLDVLLEPLTMDDLPHLLAITSLLSQRQAFARETWASGCRIVHADAHDAVLSHRIGGSHLDVQGRVDRIGIVRRVFQPRWRLLLVGAGEVARQLAQLALPAGFDVTLCDHRDDFLQGFHVPHVRIAYTQPDQLVKQQFSDQYSAIVALAHDPRLDDLALLDAFDTQAYYIGAMGSQRTSTLRRQRLQELGISSAQLQRLHAPIGLDIGSKTPYEIAISILAHLLQQRPKATTNSLDQHLTAHRMESI